MAFTPIQFWLTNLSLELWFLVLSTGHSLLQFGVSDWCSTIFTWNYFTSLAWTLLKTLSSSSDFPYFYFEWQLLLFHIFLFGCIYRLPRRHLYIVPFYIDPLLCASAQVFEILIRLATCLFIDSTKIHSIHFHCRITFSHFQSWQKQMSPWIQATLQDSLQDCVTVEYGDSLCRAISSI